MRKDLWVQQRDKSQPHNSLINRILWVLNSELHRSALTLLICDAVTASDGANHRLCRQLLASEDIHTEYVEREGILHFPRLISQPRLHAEIERRLRPR